MDIRQLREERPKLGWLIDVRFNILHNHRRIADLEALVLIDLQRNGPMKVVTRENLFELSLEGERVNATIREGRRFNGLPFQAAPNPVQLFCNELLVLHKNQEQFSNLTEDEIQQVFLEFREAAHAQLLLVTKGRHALKLRIEGQRLHFDCGA
jgi:hypothetical protein